MIKIENDIDNASLVDVVRMLQKQIMEHKHRIEVIEHELSDAKDVLTVEEAALFLGLSKSFLYKMTHEGTIPFYKPNGKICYFEKTELLKWMRSNKMASQAEIENRAQEKIQQLAMK